MAVILSSKREQIAQACRRHNVARLDVFGSALRDDFREGQSDVDLLVEFHPMDPYALTDAYYGLLEELQSALGAKVDLVMADALKNRYIAAIVQRTKQPLYAA